MRSTIRKTRATTAPTPAPDADPPLKRAVSRNIAHAHGPAHERLHRESEAYHDLWRGLLSAAAADGAIRTDLDLSTARMFVIGALNGSTEWFHRPQETERLVEQAQALVRHALEPHPTTDTGDPR